ncbi:MAG: GDP-mannose 4,6-dehydratase, partial [Terriglobia bacterium]
MPTYLVTGGAGFIGSNMIGEMVRRGETVRALDNLATGHIENLAAVRQAIQWHEADIRNLE